MPGPLPPGSPAESSAGEEEPNLQTEGSPCGKCPTWPPRSWGPGQGGRGRTPGAPGCAGRDTARRCLRREGPRCAEAATGTHRAVTRAGATPQRAPLAGTLRGPSWVCPCPPGPGAPWQADICWDRGCPCQAWGLEGCGGSGSRPGLSPGPEAGGSGPPRCQLATRPLGSRVEPGRAPGCGACPQGAGRMEPRSQVVGGPL